MDAFKVISADTHIVEPPDLYITRVEPEFRDRAPRAERRTATSGKEYDAWMLDGLEVTSSGRFVEAGERYKDPAKLQSLAAWEDVQKGAYEPHAMLKELETDGVWGACIQPSAGLLWYRIPDGKLLSALCRAYNNWMADFCKPVPTRLKGIGCINVDNIEEACRDLEQCSQLGFAGVFIPVYPLPDRRYNHPIYERLWWTAQELDIPLLLHIGTHRYGIPGVEDSLDLEDGQTAAGRVTLAHWVQYSFTDMIFSGIFDRYPGLKIGTVEHEMSWILHWLRMMDFIYVEQRHFRRGWNSREGLLPSDYWTRNMFVEFMEDAAGVQLRETIGVDNILWGNDYPHTESTWPQSMEFLDRVFATASLEDRQKITSGNAARLFKFDI